MQSVATNAFGMGIDKSDVSYVGLQYARILRFIIKKPQSRQMATTPSVLSHSGKDVGQTDLAEREMTKPVKL